MLRGFLGDESMGRAGKWKKRMKAVKKFNHAIKSIQKNSNKIVSVVETIHKAVIK